MRVYIHGAGKVGRALAGALRDARWKVELRPARAGLPEHEIDAAFVVLAVRDRDLAPLASALASRKLVASDAVCVHVAGALDAEPLAPLRAVCRGVAQMHPMIAFASTRVVPTLEGGHVHVQGDSEAVLLATKVARALKMTPRTFPKLDTVGYHAAAGLVANGGAALAALGAEVLVRSGVPREVAPAMLGPLLRSVADNVEALGFPDALTGPVRRGDAGGLERHVAALKARFPDAVPLYVESAAAQLPLAERIGDAAASDLASIGALLARLRTRD